MNLYKELQNQISRSVTKIDRSEALHFFFNSPRASWVQTNQLTKRRVYMKKTTITLIALLVSELSFAHGFTTGSYKGNGLWNSRSAKGVYQTTTVIDKNTIKAHYSLPDGSSRDWSFDIQNQASTFFDVISQGTKIGSGYCLEKALVCHYELSVGQLKLEETLVQEGTKIYRYGSKDEGKGPIAWQESLDKE